VEHLDHTAIALHGLAPASTDLGPSGLPALDGGTDVGALVPVRI
jgi:hypothetical protein